MPIARPGWPLPARTRCLLRGQPVSLLERDGDDPPVVLLHGWGASAASFNGLLRQSRSRRRLVALDLPGFGESPIGDGGWTTAAYSQLVREWLSTRGWDRFSLLGHSYGGSVSIRIAAEAGLQPDRLLLCSASGIRPAAQATPGLRVRSFKALRAFAGWLPAPASRLAEEWLTQRFGSADYRAASPELRRTLVAAVREDLSPQASQLSVPTLVIWGARDTELPLEPHGRRLEALIGPAELVVFESSGHFPFLDEPGRFARVFDAFMDAEL
ncbi:MAG: alpha/beta fold hydrolase [Candidatus Dormibacteria bacterium]